MAGGLALSCKAHENFDTAFAAGKNNQKQGRYTQAIKDFSEALETTRQLKNKASTRFELANCYFKLKNYAKAAEYYKAVVNTPMVMEYLAYRAQVSEGKCYYYLKKYSKAVEVLAVTAVYAKKHSRFYTVDSQLFLGRCYYFQKKYTLAKECFVKAGNSSIGQKCFSKTIAQYIKKCEEKIK
jgi:tetratricopeptide (TPR) repeat protein